MFNRYSVTANKEIRIKLLNRDVLSIDDISRQCINFPEFLVKPNYVKHNSLYFSLPKEMTLYKFLEKSISIKQFFSIIEGIVKIIIWTKENEFLEDCLIKDLKFVYINTNSPTIKMVYVPVADIQRKRDTLNFIKQIAQEAKMNTSGEKEIVNHFYDFLNSQTRFNTEQTIKFIGNTSTNTLGLEDDDKTDMMKDDTSTEFMDDDSDTVLDDDETVFEEDFTFSEPKDINNSVCPLLNRLSTGEDIYINKSVFRIGKDANVVDYYVDNPAISRSHADIIIKENRCFIMDLKSKNKTYLNGAPLLINKEYEINNDDLIRLADEEFVFKV